jgi:hypothetical protein
MSELRRIVFLGLALLAYSQCICQTVESRTQVVSELPIHVQLSVVAITRGAISFDLEIVNSGANAVYAVIDPIKSDGSKGPSLSISSQDASTLQIEVRLFAPPSYNLYMNGAQANLKLLHPGDKCVQHLSLPRPLHNTEPPYEWANRGTQISDTNVSKAQAVVGIFPDVLEMAQLMNPQSGPQAVTGLEHIKHGETATELYRVQKLFSSQTIPLSLVSTSVPGTDTLVHESGHVVDPPKQP